MAATLTLLILSLAFPFFTSPKAPKTPVQLVEMAEKSLVRLTYVKYDENGEEETHVCTGFVISASKGIAMTAAHCVSMEYDNFADDKPTKVIKLGEHLALISVPVMTRPPLEFRKGLINVGESIVSVGFGFGALKAAGRLVAGFDSGFLVADGPLYPGMSGGPILDVYGAVVGINQATTDALALACRVDEMVAFTK